MSRDVVALVRERPDITTALEALTARGLRPLARAITTDLFDAQGRLVITVAEPAYIQVPDEAERLLGVTCPAPVWWVDLRAAGDLPEAEQLARMLAGELVRRHGGAIWSGAAP